MNVIYEKLPSRRREYIATIGVFDGIHRGHQFILKKVSKLAQRKKTPSLVVTFDISPKSFLNKNFSGCIIDLEEKKSLIKSLGIDYLWILKVHASFLKLSGEEFINYILKYVAIDELIVGDDFHFGYRGENNINCLKRLKERFRFGLTVVKRRKREGKIVSSSLIREFIREGQFGKVKKFLGRNYFLRGEVFKGLGYGQKLGFPTANIHTFDCSVPRRGAYAAIVEIGRKKYLSAVNIGLRPTIAKPKAESRKPKAVVEAHIINFHKDILGKTLKIIFLERIREERKFSSLQQLKQAIRKDIQYILSKMKL